MPTLWTTRTAPALLAETVQALTDTGPEVFGRPAAELFRAHGGNLRDALREMYDVCAVSLQSEAPHAIISSLGKSGQKV